MLTCQVCDTYFHFKCSGLLEREFVKLRNENKSWTCHKCTLPQFSDDLFNDFIGGDTTHVNGTDFDIENETDIPVFKKGVKMGLLNVNRLLPHMHQLSTTLHTLKFQVLCVVETWLSDNIQTDEIAIDDYNTLRLDRTEKSSNK